MTGSFSKVYEETYKNHLIEIYCFMQSTPGRVSAFHYTIKVDGKDLEGDFDDRGFNDYKLLTPEQSAALTAARTYCDSLKSYA